MPLVLLTGYPSSGKSHRASQLVDFFKSKIAANTALPAHDSRISRLKVHHVSDQTLGLTRDVYREARSEKVARAAEYSAIKRLLGRDDIVVADGLNYIKGFRYQLFCDAKAVSTPSCVIHVGTAVSTCRDVNTRLLADASGDGGYAEDIFENLVFRYEEPNGMTRWDSPLFTVLYDDATPPLDEIWEALIGSDGKVKTAKPNQATVLKPATDSDYLYELDRITQEILSHILSYQRDHPGEGGGQVRLSAAAIDLPASPMSLPQLQRLRRQFINLNRQHALPQSRITNLFADYLNDSFQAQ